MRETPRSSSAKRGSADKRRFDPAFVAPVSLLVALFLFALVGAIVTGSWIGTWLMERAL